VTLIIAHNSSVYRR